MATVKGLRLVSGASSAPQSIPGLVGLWSTDAEQSVVPADLGIDSAELAEKARALGYEVEEVEWEREVVDEETGKPLTIAEIEEGIEHFSDDELATLAADERKGARALAEAEIERRAAGGEPEGEGDE